MTCCVGLVDKNGDIYMGGDSAGVAGWDLVSRQDAKVFANGEFVFGFTSSFRMGQILRYAFDPPAIDPSEPLMRYMVTRFVDAIRAAFKAAGYAQTTGGQETAGTFLVGVRGRLFTIHSDYQVAESRYGYAAVGCGAQTALGAMFATHNLPPKRRISIALLAAEDNSAGVRGPFEHVYLRGKPEFIREQNDALFAELGSELAE